MNFPAVINSDEKMHAEMFETRRSGKVIGGHYASPDLGLPFHGYVAGGPEDDHEGNPSRRCCRTRTAGYESDAATWLSLA
jgi:adenine deaminase